MQWTFKLLESDKSTQVDASSCSDKSTKVDALKLSVISWNIEGFSRNFYTLFHLVNQYSAKLIFISEPQVYKCDLTTLIQPFIGSYESYLNSEDVHDSELPLTHPRAKGGTMVMWHKSLSPHLKVLETSSSSYVSVLLSPPGHTAVYLPTAGKEGEWLSSLLDLEQHVMEVIEKHHGELATYLRGDFNASTKNKTRATYLSAAVSR